MMAYMPIVRKKSPVRIWDISDIIGKTGCIALICFDVPCLFLYLPKGNMFRSSLVWLVQLVQKPSFQMFCSWHDTVAGCRNFSPIRWMKPLPGARGQQKAATDLVHIHHIPRLFIRYFQIIPACNYHLPNQKQGGLVHVGARDQQDG